MAGELSRITERRAQRAAAGRLRTRRVLGVVASLLAVAVLGTVGLSVFVGWGLTHPKRGAVNETPASVGLAFETVQFPSDVDGVTLRGWFLPAPAQNPAHLSPKTIILSHGYAGDRLEKGVPALGLAKVLVGAGYNVLMFDFRNSGLSDGNITTVGYYEVADLLGAIHYLKQARAGQAQHVGLIGFSMGAVVSGLAAAREPAAEAVIMDSPFADLRSYLADNMPHWTHLPDFPFTWVILHTLPLVEHVDMRAVSPLAVMPTLKQPVLLIHGDADQTVPLRNSEELVKAASSGKVRLWVVHGAGHVGSRKVQQAEYDRRVLDFLAQNLGQ
ncbi:MAG: alpha/beta hydrolase [Symbiobacteriia bacterium]